MHHGCLNAPAMDALLNQGPKEEPGGNTEVISAVKEEADGGNSSELPGTLSGHTSTWSGLTDRVAWKEAETPVIKQEESPVTIEWSGVSPVKTEWSGVSPVKTESSGIGLVKTESSGVSPAQIEVVWEPGTETDEGSKKRSGFPRRGRKRARLVPQEPRSSRSSRRTRLEEAAKVKAAAEEQEEVAAEEETLEEEEAAEVFITYSRKTLRKSRKRGFYGVEKDLAKMERESEAEDLVESDSSVSCDSSEDDELLHVNGYGSDEEWDPPGETSKRPRSITPTSETTLRPSQTLSSPDEQKPDFSTPTVTSSAVERRWSERRRAQDEDGPWHDVKKEDVERLFLPKFLPKRTPGPQLSPTMTYSPLHLFQLFFSTSTVQTLVNNTNKFAELSAAAGKKLQCTPVSVSEFYTFISLVIYMGLVKAKTLADYWSQKYFYRFPFPHSVMSSKRFNDISSNLHLSDPLEDAKNMKKKGTSGYDSLFKIKPLCSDILSACQSHFHPRRELSIDKRMVASKERNGLKQHMKAKPTKWGFKLFILADAASGYTWNFFVYKGKSPNTTEKGLSYDSVKTLLDHSLLGSGYKVYMDSFFTSPTLFTDLLQQKTLACGPISSSQQGLLQTKRKNLYKRGTIRWYRQGKLLYVKWMDTREVNMCSTMHKAYTGETVNRQIKNRRWKWSTVAVPVPDAVKDYSKYMGGVDISDEYYNVFHKSKKWYKTFLFHSIEIAIVNSFVLHQELAKMHGQGSLAQKAFREVLMVELSNLAKSSTGVAEENCTAKVNKCMPAFYSTDATTGRRKCVNCTKEGEPMKTPVYCTECNVPLCLVPNRNCFSKWHEKNLAPWSIVNNDL